MLRKTLNTLIQKLRSVGSNERIILAAIAALFLPDTYLAAVMAAICAFILFDRDRLGLLRRSPAAPALIPLLPVLIVPSIVSGHVYGIVTGLVVWTLFVFGLFAAEIMTDKFIPFVMDALLVCSASDAVYGVICKLLGILELGRVSSFFENPNHYAYAVELFVLIALCRYTCTRRSIYLAVAVMNLLMNLLCGCRTAWLAILAAVTVYAMLTVQRSWMLAVSAAAGGALAFCLRLIPEIGERLSVDSVSHSLDNRMRYWENSLRWFSRRPLIGWGVSSYSFLSASEGEKVLTHAHNMILNILLDTGVAGFLLLSVIVFLWTRDLFTRSPGGKLAPYRNLATSALVATLVHGLTDFTLLGVSTSIIFVLVLSVSGCVRREQVPEDGVTVPFTP